MTMSELAKYDYINLNNFSVQSNSKSGISLQSDYSDIQESNMPESYISKNFSTQATVPSDCVNTQTEKEVFCKKCGRLLKDSKSRILGMGPTCYKQHQLSRNRQINLFCLKGFGNTDKDDKE